METNILWEYEPTPVLYGFYIDGSAQPNPGPASWAVVVTDLVTGMFVKECSGVLHAASTNNRAELYAVIRALESDEARKADRILITTDSKYVKLGITEWINKWTKNYWQGASGLIKNRDLWEIVLEDIKGKDIEWAWVKGHSGNKWNERCDQLCREALANGRY